MVEKENEYYEEHAKIIEECQKKQIVAGNYEKGGRDFYSRRIFRNEAAFLGK